MPTNAYYKNRIIIKYAALIKEYFQIMNHSELFKTMTDINPSLYIGINAINRVFEYMIMKTKNIEHAYFHSQKSYYYYLEYLEQIHKSDMTLNHMDAVLFVYKKTIYHDNETVMRTSDTISNIMTLQDEIISIETNELKQIMDTLFHSTSLLLFWENMNITATQRMHITTEYLDRYLVKFDYLELIGTYIELTQKITMNYQKYVDLLHEIIEKVERTKKNMRAKEIDKTDCFFVKFYMDQDTFYKKFHDETTKDLVKWLFV